MDRMTVCLYFRSWKRFMAGGGHNLFRFAQKSGDLVAQTFFQMGSQYALKTRTITLGRREKDVSAGNVRRNIRAARFFEEFGQSGHFDAVTAYVHAAQECDVTLQWSTFVVV